MATKVQSKTYFPGSMMDLNNGFCNSMWDPYHDDRTPASEKNQYYNSFMMMQAMDGYSGYAKEKMRQTMLKQDSIFRHQLEELHRLYKRQRDLMNELTMKQQYNHPKSSTNQRRVIDLELPPDVYEENEEKQQPVENVHKLADLNEPINMEEPQPQPQPPSFPPTNSTLWYGNGESNKPIDQIPRKRTIFGVELCERSHTTTPIDSSQNLEKKLPSWLMVKPNTSNEQQPKGKETTIYQMNLESLQHHSHQFFNKSEIITNPKSETDNNNNNHQGFITKILGVPIIDMKDSVKENGKVNNLRHQIDLNLTLDEQEGPTSTSYIIPESVVKIASMEIDLEAPQTDTHSDNVLMESDDHLVKAAAEAIMSISSEPPLAADATAAILRWFAEVVAFDEKKDSENVNSDEESITIVPEGMDYLEYMTLKIQETKEKYDSYKPMEEENQESGLLRKRTTTRKGQGKRGRQRKDFQRDVLPGIVSLSRREVTEDIQTFEDAFTGMGVSWQSKRKVSGKNGRGRRRSVEEEVVVVVEQSVCREEKGLSGWGKRTRRLPRQRCQNGGGSHQSLALKC